MRRYLSCAAAALLFFHCTGSNSVSITSGAQDRPTLGLPVFSSQPGNFSSDLILSITSPDAGAEIYYTLDSSEPNASKLRYTAPLNISGHGTTRNIKAVAIRSDANASGTISGSFVINYLQVSSPTIAPSSGAFGSGAGIWNNAITVTLHPWPGTATLRYTTNGNDPFLSGTTYSGGGISVTSDGTVIRAGASQSQKLDSQITSVTVTLKTADVTFSPAATEISGTQQITLASATSGATIRYTTDGSTPTTTTGTVYTGPFVPNGNASLRAMAYRSQFQDSAVTIKTYTATAQEPVFSLAAGDYFSAQSLALAVADSNLSIRYTTDGSEPSSTNGLIYTGTLSLTATTQIKAIAFGPAYAAASPIVSRTYTFWPADTNIMMSISQGYFLDRVDITWPTFAGAVSYNLYRSTSSTGPFTLLTNTTALSYADSSATAGVRYYYRLAAVVAGGEARPGSIQYGHRNPGGSYEPNDLPSLAHSMTSGFGVLYSMQLESPYDIDYFRFHANSATFRITIGNLAQGTYSLNVAAALNTNIVSPYNGYTYVGYFSISSTNWYYMSLSSASQTSTGYTLRIDCCF